MAEVAQMPSEPVPLDSIPISPNGDAAADVKDTASDGEIVTVFHDPENFNVKHPLAHQWTLWFTKPPSGKVRAHRVIYTMHSLMALKQDWNELLKEVITFDTVEEFWGIYVSPRRETANVHSLTFLR
jgi:translation initiation factor 4E